MTTSTLATKAMLVSLTVTSWPGTLLDKEATEDIRCRNDADPGVGRYVKRLLPKDALATIHRLGRLAYQEHRHLTLPWDDHGMRLLPVAVYDEYASAIDKLAEDRRSALEELLAAYPRHIETAAQILGTLYNPADYPPAETVRQKFAIDYYYLPVPDADHFVANLAEADAQQIRERIREDITNRLELSIIDLYRRIAASVAACADRLEPDDDGNAKIFRNTLIDNLRDIASLAPRMALRDDAQLAEICDSIRAATDGLDPDHLRPSNKAYDPERREQLKAAMTDLQGRMARYFSVEG